MDPFEFMGNFRGRVGTLIIDYENFDGLGLFCQRGQRFPNVFLTIASINDDGNSGLILHLKEILKDSIMTIPF